MDITEKERDGILIYSIAGSLDTNTSPTLEEKIMDAINSGTNKMIIDFSNLDYISSAGLRVLNKTTKKLKHNDGTIVLCSMQDYIKEVFEIAGFDYFITIVPSMDDAITKF